MAHARPLHDELLMHRLPIVPLTAVALALLLTACGDDDPVTGSDPGADPTPTEEPGSMRSRSEAARSSSSSDEGGAGASTTANGTQSLTPTEDGTSSPARTEPSTSGNTGGSANPSGSSDEVPSGPPNSQPPSSQPPSSEPPTSEPPSSQPPSSEPPSSEPPSSEPSDSAIDCFEACGVGCPAPEFQPCGEDANRYCNTCIMDCLGIREADDPRRCEAPQQDCALPASRVHVPTTVWSPPGFCSDAALDLPLTIWDDEEELRSALRCAAEDDLGIDFDRQRLLWVPMPENPTIEIWGVQETVDGAALIAYARAPVYCGGAAPPTSAVWLILPADGRFVRPDQCLYGDCGSGPPRP